MIRKAEKTDLSYIMKLLHQVNDVHADGRPDLFVKGHTKYTPDEVACIIENPSTPVFVCTNDDQEVVGYCFCILLDHSKERHLAPIKTLYIDDLCVNENERGQHVGRALYEYARLYARENGFHNITLNVWSKNLGAIKFYESIGLRPYKIGMEEIL